MISIKIKNYSNYIRKNIVLHEQNFSILSDIYPVLRKTTTRDYQNLPLKTRTLFFNLNEEIIAL